MISVIVPIYKGKQYIDDLVKMIEDNVLYLNSFFDVTVELIFVNDFPDEKLHQVYSNDNHLIIKSKERMTNGGIHKARLDGLKIAEGEYVIFLDQDDKVKKQWMKELFECGVKNNALVVVCNGWRDRYTPLCTMEVLKNKVNDLDCYLDEGNPIVSPGQVLIKKDIIPQEWIRNEKNKNGSDDHLLWLILKKKGIEFTLCEDYLYFHNPERHDHSITQRGFYDSHIEDLDILTRENLISDREYSRLEKMIGKIQPEDCVKVSPSELVFRMYRLRLKGKTIGNYLKANNVVSIAIYGLGKIGVLLSNELQADGISIDYYVDKNAMDYYEEKTIYRIADDFPIVDLIIDTTYRGIASNEKSKIEDKGINLIRLYEIIAKCEHE